jgi:signal transduction histidine kinase
LKNSGFISGRNQLQWVVLLLAAGVALPTVCLLWFMVRAVSNERLVAGQRLSTKYQEKLTEAATKTDAVFTGLISGLDKIKPDANPYSFFTKLILEDNYRGVIVLDVDGTVIYPVTAYISGDDISLQSRLADTRRLEFTEHKYAEAARLYETLSNDNDFRTAIAAIIGESRCLARIGRVDEAIEQCQKAAFARIDDNAEPALRLAVENARMMLLTLVKQSEQPKLYSEIARRAVDALVNDVYNRAAGGAILPANQNLFIARKVLEIIQDGGPALDSKIKDRLEKLTAAEEISISTAENQALIRTLTDRATDIILRAGDGFCLCHKVQSVTLIVLLSETNIASILAGYRDVFAGSEATYQIVDGSGVLLAGDEKAKGKPFVTAALGGDLSGFSVKLYFGNDEVFEKFAKRQIAIYTWTGVLVILLIFAAGGVAVVVVSRQIRLNRMKNDFIATVSHELKTPLASMRVLVDTLLEGNIKDETQAEEYLRLTSKENERLSRMIDNFLTFSRMERNKKAFSIAQAKPAAIAGDAIEAAKTKYAAQNCELSVDIADNLPEIQADHDAIVTVIVNLLDNACKYTGDDKKISLKVFADDGNVCFAVSDNGIGIARRHIRRLFDSFYQVDQTLSRKAEGCGLGLSIVKFIVDAHKGKISVDSKPGKGSIFTVKIPVSGELSG